MNVGVLVDIEWPIDRIEETARVARDYNFDQLWVNEHPLDWDPFLVLQRASLSTGDMPLGIGTINPWGRHPAVIAASAATLAEATGTTVSLGIGSGAPPLFPPLGIELENVVTGCAEAMEMIRELTSGQVSSMEGEVFRTRQASLGFDAPKGAVSVLLGVSGGPRMLEIAGRLADGIIVPAGNHSFYDSMVSDYLESRRNGPMDGPGLVVVNGNVLVDEATAQAETRARQLVAHSLAYRVKTSLHALGRMGLEKETAQAWASDPATIPRSFLDETLVWGAPEACVDGLLALENLGIDQFVLRFPSLGDLAQVGEAVLPGFRARSKASG